MADQFDVIVIVIVIGMGPGGEVAASQLLKAGNSFWEDSRRRHDALAEQGLHFLDIGTSGGIDAAPGWNGAAFMAGGPREGFEVVEPLLTDSLLR